MKKFFKTLGWALSWIFVFFAGVVNLLTIHHRSRKFKKNPKELFLEERLKPVYKLLKKVIYLKRIEIVTEDFDRLPEKPLLITPNHKGSYDPVAVFIALYESGHMSQTAFVAKAELQKTKSVKWILDLLGSIFIQRDNGRSIYNAYLQENERIKEGYSIIVFPEGTRVKQDEFGEFKAASLKPAMENYIAIQPVAIYGTIDVKKRGTNGKHKIYVKALKTVQPNTYITTKQEYLMESIKSDIQQAYNELKAKAELDYKK